MVVLGVKANDVWQHQSDREAVSNVIMRRQRVGRRVSRAKHAILDRGARPSAPDDVAGLAAEAKVWITTEKDAGKLLPSWLGEVEMRVLVLATEFPRGEAFLDWLEEKLHAHAGGRDATLPLRT